MFKMIYRKQSDGIPTKHRQIEINLFGYYVSFVVGWGYYVEEANHDE